MIKKTTITTLKVLAALLVTVVLLLALTLWKLVNEPQALQRLIPHIERALSSDDGRLQTRLPSTSLIWDGSQFGFRFQANDATMQLDGKSFAVLPKISFSIHLASLFFGRIAPTQVQIDGLAMMFERRADGSMAIEDMSGGSVVATEAPAWQEVVAEILGRKSGLLAGFGLLSNIKLRNTRIQIHNAAADHVADFVLPELYLTRDALGVEGGVRLDTNENGQAGHFQFDFSYDQWRKQLTLLPQFEQFNPAYIGKQHSLLNSLLHIALPLTGTMKIVLDKDFQLLSAAWDLKGGAGQLVIPVLWPQPRPLAALQSKGSVDWQNHSAAIDNIIIDFGGPLLTGSYMARPRGRDQAAFTASLSLTNLPLDDFSNVWPEQVAPKPRAWITEHMHVGTMTNFTATAEGQGPWDRPDEMILSQAAGTIEVKNATVAYYRDLSPIVGISASARFDHNEMDIKTTGGSIRDTKLLPADITIHGLSDPLQTISLRPKLEGPIGTVMAVLDQEPLGYAKALGFDPQAIDGQAHIEARFEFPLLRELPMADVKITTQAKINKFSAKDLMKGMPITNGAMTLDLTNDGFALSGQAALKNVPLDVKWAEHFHVKTDADLRRHMEISGNVTPEQISRLGIDAGVAAKGKSAVKLTLDKTRGGAMALRLEADATASELRLNDVAFEKTIGQKLQLLVEGHAVANQDSLTLQTISLKGDGVDVQGTGTINLNNGNIEVLALNPFVLGLTNAQLNYLNDSSGSKLSITGKSLASPKHDDRPADYQPEATPLDLSIDVDKLMATRTQALTDVTLKAVRDRQGWRTANLIAYGEQGVPLKLELRPDKGVQYLNITSDNIGAILKAWNLSQDVVGGRFSVVGRGTAAAPRRIQAKLEVKDYRVKNMPAIATLINAISVVGLADMANGEGLQFNRMAGDLIWDKDELIFENVRTSGGTLGMAVSGRVNLANYTATATGTVVPFSFINRALSNIPLLGDILTGTDGAGVFAIAFHAKGPLKKMDVSVNPASALTPGILRQMFFMGEK